MKTNTIYINGKTLDEIAMENGLNRSTVRHRYARGVRDYKSLIKPTNRTRMPLKLVTEGQRFLYALNDNKANLAEISKKTGIARSTIYAFMYDGVDISSGRLAKLCSCYGISADYVLGFSKKMYI